MQVLVGWKGINYFLEKKSESHRHINSECTFAAMYNETTTGISIRQLSKCQADNVAIDQLTLYIPLYKKTAIIGETGSGKSTLLKLIAGLEQPDAGDIYYGKERIKGPNEQLIPGHPQIAYLSQYAELRNNYKISEILDYNNLLTKSKAEEIYRICNVQHLIHRWSDELSGGEKQRVALAQLLTKQPQVILLDEPFSHLDNFHKKSIQKILDLIVKEMGVTCVMVTHDSRDVFGWADEIHVLRKGNWVQSGTPDQLFHQPVDVYVAGLLGEFQLLPVADFIFPGGPLVTTKDDLFILIRPGYFSPNFPDGLKVKVLECKFRGEAYELEVSSGNLIFSIYLSSLHEIDLNYLSIGYNRNDVHLIRESKKE